MSVPGRILPATASLTDLQPAAGLPILYSLSAAPPHDATFVSDVVTEWLGVSPAALIETPSLWAQLVHPDDLPRIQAEMALVLERDFCDTAYRVRHKDGRWIWVRDVVRVVRDADGHAKELIGRIVDISAARQIQHQLKQSEQRYRQLVELAHAGVWAVDTKGITTYVNRKMAEMLGTTVDDMTGRPFADFLDSDNTAVARAYLERSRRGHSEELELQFVRTTGETLWTTVASSPIFDDAGVYQGAFGMVADIGPRKQAEETRRDEFVRNIVENITQGYYVTDANSHFTYCNPAVAIVSGRPISELIGTSAFTLLVEEDRERVAAAYRQWARDGSSNVTIECRVRSHTGRVILVEQTTQIVRNALGEVTAFANFLRDITDRRAAEDALRQLSVRLRSVQEQERTRISREIHDVLGQLLTGIRMDLRWLEKHHGSFADQPEQARSDARIKGAVGLVDEALRTVQNIAADLRPGVLDHLGLATAVHHEVGRFGQRTGITCEVARAPELEKPSPDVETAVFRILQEVLTNIARHAGATRVVVTLDAIDGLITLTVTDDGRGISPDDIAEPRSLGLLGMKERAHLLGGEVTITGTAGQGTIVTVQIPANATEQGEP